MTPKKDDILFYYLKDGDNRAKLKLKVLEYPSGNSVKDVFAEVVEVVELTFDQDEIQEGLQDFFDIRDLDSHDVDLDDFVPHSVDELVEFSKVSTNKPAAVGGRVKRHTTPRKTKTTKRKTRGSKVRQRKLK